jgi:hypothetical protein
MTEQNSELLIKKHLWCVFSMMKRNRKKRKFWNQYVNLH